MTGLLIAYAALALIILGRRIVIRRRYNMAMQHWDELNARMERQEIDITPKKE